MRRCMTCRGGGIMNKSKHLIWRSLREIFHVSPKHFVIVYVISALQGLLNAVPVICLQILFDEVTAITTGEFSRNKIILSVVALLFVRSALQVLAGVGDYLYEYHELLCMKQLIYKTNEKVSREQAICFEEKEYLDELEKAYRGAGNVRKVADTALLVLLNYIPSFLVLGWYLYQAKPILLVVIGLIFIPSLLAYLNRQKEYKKLHDETASLDRQINTYASYMTHRDYMKETRMLGIFSWLYERVESAIQERGIKTFRTMCKSERKELYSRLVSVIGYVSILCILFVSVKNGEISVGYFAAVFAYLDQLFTMMEEIVYEVFGHVAELLGRVEAYFKLHAEKELKAEVEKLNKLSHITMEDVCFSYPHSKETALKHVSLELLQGEYVAVVGENGSGKSTLIKLLMGLYEPTSGTVMYDENQQKRHRPREIVNHMSAVCQDYGRYQMSVGDNIRLGNWDSGEPIEQLLSDFGISMKEDTLLSREFGGEELSGGQWQRVALARGYYKVHDILFLDEPTAAIDPLEEAQLYTYFSQMAKGKTTVVVTHRMGAAQMADRIIVMKAGEIVGQGSHAQLIEQCQEYRRLWNAQAQQYR